MNLINNKWPFIFFTTNLVIICLVLIRFINLEYPRGGHDYSYIIPQLLDTAYHFRHNGLITQWYTPTFGGGLPAFPNPNNIQFSMPAALSILMEPWKAIIISSILFVSIGFFASAYLFYRVLKLHWTSCLLGAMFFSANGFILQRIAVGHLGYQTFPLLALILVLIFDTSLPASIAGLLIGAILGLLIHQAGYLIIVVFCLSSLMIFPLIHFLQPNMFFWRRIFITLVSGGLIGLLLSASKLSAVFSFMRFFPRLTADVYMVNSFSAIFGLILQLLGTMNLVPLFAIARLDPNMIPSYLAQASGALYRYWEFDMSLSPVLFALIIAGTNKFFYAPRSYLRKITSHKKWVTVLFLLFFTWLTVEFTLATGWFYPLLRQLPILSSMHVNARFAAAFLFPLTLLAAVTYNSFSKKWSPMKSTRLFLLVNILTLLPLCTYFMFTDDLQGRIYDLSATDKIYQSIRTGDKFAVTAISAKENNTQALQKGLSNLNLYEPIFGYNLETFHPEIKAGSIWDVSNGYFNMTNPSGYVFPESNNTRPFERIKLQDRDKLLAFANYNQPDWELPLYQKVCNWVSALALGFVAIFLSLYAFRALLNNRSNHPTGENR